MGRRELRRVRDDCRLRRARAAWVIDFSPLATAATAANAAAISSATVSE